MGRVKGREIKANGKGRTDRGTEETGNSVGEGL